MKKLFALFALLAMLCGLTGAAYAEEAARHLQLRRQWHLLQLRQPLHPLRMLLLPHRNAATRVLTATKATWHG